MTFDGVSVPLQRVQTFSKSCETRLLWINPVTTSAETRHAHTGIARQHVMIDYLEKQAVSDNASKPPQGISSVIIETATCRPNRASGDAASEGCCTERGDKPLISGFGKSREPVRYLEGFAAALPPPIAALCTDTDRKVYRAAWYHTRSPQLPHSQARLSWKNQCKLGWNQAFWEFARNDPTLLEIFLSFAAAKTSVGQTDG
jgi:hypothetical protein